MSRFSLKPTHKAVQAYYASLAKFGKLGITHESAVRSAFAALLDNAAGQLHWKLVPEHAIARKGAKPLKADGAVLDNYGLTRGIWEAKDSDDDLEKEIKAKFAVGYPKDNILFQEPRRAVLYQNGQRVLETDLAEPGKLVDVLRLFLDFAPPAIANWEKAVEQFKDKVPELGASLQKLIRSERQTNAKFIKAFGDFVTLCRASINPNLREEAVEEMLIQHLLTERIFRKVFDVADFMQRNVIAVEIEKVIAALTSKAFSRDDFTQRLEHFYGAIENAAATIHDFNQKQHFLNTVYERFFQGFSVQVADTHGIVYTPQSLVQFMIASVEDVLRQEFSKSLADRDVQILDPFTGTGNFIVSLIRRIAETRKAALPHKFAEELFCNELMLLPYYIASMNIEHAYYEAVGRYEPFAGICLVDTFETINGHLSYYALNERHEQQDLVLFNPENTKRINRQKTAPIRVILANPPYNAGQVNENDNNKNRKYPELDRRVSVTYGADSKATLLRKLADPYVKAIRYATDRIGDQGIVCYVNNNSFITEKTFDGLRKHLAGDFDLIYVLDLGGNVRKNPKLSGTTHNVFGIQVGVSINLFIKLPRRSYAARKPAKILYHAVPVPWRREEKYKFLETAKSIAGVTWRTLKPDKNHNWLTSKNDEEFDEFLPVGSKEAKAGTSIPVIFKTYSLGVSTNRDEVVYDFDAKRLAKRVEQFADDYNAELHRWTTKAKPPEDPKLLAQYIDSFVSYEKVKWSETLKRHLVDAREAEFASKRITRSLYRPFAPMDLYYDGLFVDRPSLFGVIFPTKKTHDENPLICVNLTVERPFACLATNLIPNLVSAGGFGCATYCLPMFTYSREGKERRDNITGQALIRFQNHFDDNSIKRLDIFHYVYALLHHPAYRTRYAENLRRELPRIPFLAAGVVSPPLDCTGATGDDRSAKEIKQDNERFWAFAEAGKRLAELHVHYEQQPEFPLARVENKESKLDWRVEAMKLTKDRSALIYNDWLTLAGIPSEVFDYRLGNRSALEWVIDQYRVTRDADGEIVRDPNRLDDEQYIVRLVGQVVHVSVETLKIIQTFPDLKFP
ncbi:MAG TPA: type ISP restriction/modification enzyme [Verrucomicrobiae bacterium]